MLRLPDPPKNFFTHKIPLSNPHQTLKMQIDYRLRPIEPESLINMAQFSIKPKKNKYSLKITLKTAKIVLRKLTGILESK